MKRIITAAAIMAAMCSTAYAESGKGVGSWSDQPHDEFALQGGDSYNMSRSKQVWFSENVPKLNNISNDCFTSWVAVKDSDTFFGRGWCTGIDSEWKGM
jgi:hypothetical protein